jgi:hypothetical protein
MVFNNVQLSVDIKAQDRLREWFAQRQNGGTVDLTHVALGDSDINYQMSQQYGAIKILSTPFNIPDIKHKLLHTGGVAGVTGVIESYLRKINDQGQVLSLYNYPPSTNWVLGTLPPTKANQYNFSQIPFDTTNTQREGFICFNQTLPDNYFDNANNPLRLKESYDLTITSTTLAPGVLPTGWELIQDVENGSFLLAKPASYVFTNNIATIKLRGILSSITKTLTFSY